MSATLEARLEEALTFTAPCVTDRLVRDGVTDDPAEAEQLFTEAKRYLVLCAATPWMCQAASPSIESVLVGGPFDYSWAHTDLVLR
ncbi:hypothetical protein [Mycolicibacterium sarraceniae]|uniref:Uncharacterized protein n=1 Tax=Mycolicibacterium sarraceniae TaxID=1534348 RepID=A0A7I7SM33_9MYCO|nr:hypothetical protein [Mycolicibacterium sarraceniae]BBY57590.1 hypothetical protein MSAR_07260 [Mycolicibacterium sarraceniae]